MAAMLELKLFGEFELRDGSGVPVPIAVKKNKALLAVLALAPSPSLPRERLIRTLWSDRGQVQAQASLRQSLVLLRKDFASLDISPIIVTDERVTLDRNRVRVDALEFQRLSTANDVESLRRAAALYRDELLSDIDIRDAAFERWLGSERQRLFDTAIGILEKLSSREEGTARIDVAKRLLALDPLREASHRMLMAAYADAGEKGLAMRQYDVCRTRLKEELDVAPGEETETLRQRLMTDLLKANGPSTTSTPQFETSATGDDKPSIAILPFNLMNGDADLDEVSQGLTEDITTGLSRVRTIRVIARNIMFTYKDRPVDIRLLGRELGVRYVLEGSVRRSGARIRVTAQLIETASGHHVWARKFDSEGENTFDLQDQMTASIVASVQTQIILSEGKSTAAEDRWRENAAALLARSWQQFLGLTEQSLAESRSLAERALRLEPASGFGHRMLSICLYHQALMGFIPWTQKVIDDLHAHAKISIEADDADEYSHWAMASAHLLRKEHDRAIASIDRALEINPNCSLAHGSLGTLFAWAGRTDAAIQTSELALRMNPDDPSTFFRHLALAIARYLSSHYEQALVHASAVVQARPLWWLGLLMYTASLARVGRREEANRVLSDLRRVRPHISSATLKVLPFATGQDLELLLEGLREAGLTDPIESPAAIA